MAERPLDIPPGTRGPGYARAPAHRIAFVPRHARVRVAAAGTAIAKTSDVVAVEENGYPPRYYLARDGVDMTRVEKTGKLMCEGRSAVVARSGSIGRAAQVPHLGGCRSARKTQSQAERTDSAAVRARP